MAKRKPEPIEALNIWPSCTLKVLDEQTLHWKTVARDVPDTPYHIQQAKQQLRLSRVWVFHAWGEQEYH